MVYILKKIKHYESLFNLSTVNLSAQNIPEIFKGPCKIKTKLIFLFWE